VEIVYTVQFLWFVEESSIGLNDHEISDGSVGGKTSFKALQDDLENH
jgi:hypothetical protein